MDLPAFVAAHTLVGMLLVYANEFACVGCVHNTRSGCVNAVPIYTGVCFGASITLVLAVYTPRLIFSLFRQIFSNTGSGTSFFHWPANKDVITSLPQRTKTEEYFKLKD